MGKLAVSMFLFTKTDHVKGHHDTYKKCLKCAMEKTKQTQ